MRTAPRVVPVDLVWLNGRPVVMLRDVPRAASYEPFWNAHSLTRAQGRPQLVPLDHAPDLPGHDQLAGFLFHMMRCGSTLACHLLGAIPGAAALSEPMMFQSLLSGPGTPAERRAWLRRLLALFVAGICDDDERLVIKWSSLMTCHIRELAAAFPGVPAVFIHRDPTEVLVSCVEGPPGHARLLERGAFAPHLRPDPDTNASMPFAELMARFLGSVCFHAASADALRRLEYASLPSAVWTQLAGYFGLDVQQGEVRARLQQIARLDAKDTTRTKLFAADGERKQHAATPVIRDLAQRFMHPEIDRLTARHAALPSPGSQPDLAGPFA